MAEYLLKQPLLKFNGGLDALDNYLQNIKKTLSNKTLRSGYRATHTVSIYLVKKEHQ
ncbi:MAG: hypothetical protein Alis3KO_12730 [Aliiglaciecola sp.]